MLDHTSKLIPAEPADYVEARLRQNLRDYAVELRRLAYTLANGVGEHAFLQLSGRMHAAADRVVDNGS
jgi:hypothetical protein